MRHSERQKSSKATKNTLPNKTVSFWGKKRSGTLVFVGYLCLWILAAYIFYRRFPNNFRQPNFYAEDGSVFGKNLIDKGFWGSLGTTFNGYFTWGLYILEQFGFTINRLLGGGEFVNLPGSLSLVSYGFLAFVATLPALLFRKYLNPIALIFIVLLAVYVPMRGFDYAIIGTIGNLKFSFIYLAFLLLVYRHLLPAKSKQFYLVDVGLLICAYTNITVYPMMIFALLRYWPTIRQSNRIKVLLKDNSFRSLLILGLCMIPQLVTLKVNGIPQLTGYLDAGFNYSRTIEIFISRSYLYTVLFPFNKFLNNALAFVLIAGFVIIGLKYTKRYRAIFCFGLFAIILASFLFVSKRTGVSEFFSGYKEAGPDQFFYPQNWIFSFIFSVVLVEVISQLKTRQTRHIFYLVSFLYIFLAIIPNAGTYGKNDAMAKQVGNIYSVAKETCMQNMRTYNIPIYPTRESTYLGIPHQTLCTKSVSNYSSKESDLGLELIGQYLEIREQPFTQTFISPRSNLDGLSIFFSTFGARVKTPYDLTLMASDCKQALFKTKISTLRLRDNAFFTVKLPQAINDSANKKYCFSVDTAVNKPMPLAIQLSKPNKYLPGDLTVNNEISEQDVVFKLNYK